MIKCNRILSGLIVNDQGELILAEHLREHLDECAECREVYDRIEEAKSEEVPNYVPEVMMRIGDMVAAKENEFEGETVSEGTLNPEDLVPVFFEFLRRHHPEGHKQISKTWSDALPEPSEVFRSEPFKEWMEKEPSAASELLGDLVDKLNELAPIGYYFGTHEGDGALYGFWKVEE